MINPVTGLEDTKKQVLPSVGTAINGMPDPSMPAGAQSLRASITPMNSNIGGTIPAGTDIPEIATTREDVIKNSNVIGDRIGQVYNPELNNGSGAFEPPKTVVPTIAPPTTATTEVLLPVDNSKPHSVGDVWNGKTGNWELPGTTTGPATQTSQIIDQMFPKGQYSDEERKAVSDAFASKSPEEQTAFMAKNQADKYAESQKLLEAYRTTRDFGLTQERNKTLNDQRLADLTQQYDNAITSQKQKMEADANNMSVVMGTSGRLKSRNMQNAVGQMLDTNKNIYTQLVSNKDRDIARLAEDLKYAQTIASNEYNDKISDDMQNMLKNIQALDKTGSLATAQGLVQARSFIDATISNTMQHQSDYYSKLSYISQRYDQYNKDALTQSTVDDKVTSTMNDGYLYNNQGIRVKGEDGAPIRVASTSGTLLTKEPIVMNDGSKAFVYQNPDGTTRVEKIQGTETVQIDDQAIQRYAQLVSSGVLKVEDLTKLGVPQSQISSILSGIDEGAMTGTDPKDFLKLQDSDGNEYYFNPKTKETISAAEFAPQGDAPTFSGTGADGETITGAEVMKALASGKLNGQKFFGVYATGDPTGENRANAYAKIEKSGIDADLAKFPKTKITSEMINDSAAKFGIDPIMLATILKLDSSYGTAGKGARNNNPGNVGQFDSLDAKGITVKGYKTLEEGVDAVSSNLKNRLKAMADMTGTSLESTNEPEAPKENQYTGVAQDIVDGTIKSSDLKALGYKPSEIKQIESERMRLSSQSSEGKLSTAGQRAVSSKSITETGKAKTTVLNELQNSGVFDRGEGNQNYYEAKSDVKSEMPNFFNARDSFNKAKAIVEKHRTSGDLDEFLGGYDASQQRIKGKTGAFFGKYGKEFQADFDALDNLLGKELSQYMKNISGATVTEAEAERLKRQIPNLDMSETQFDQAMQIYDDSLKNAGRYLINHYGFTDDKTARSVILGGEDKNTIASTSGKSWKDYE